CGGIHQGHPGRSPGFFLRTFCVARSNAGKVAYSKSVARHDQTPMKHLSRSVLRFLPLTGLLAGMILFAGAVQAQRDHLTDAETALIRYYRELDKRTEVFIKAADRRFAIINGTAQPSTKKANKEEPDWGDVPKGTRAQLLDDVAGILDEAITNIDDVSRRDEKNPMISRSLRKLTAAVNGYLAQLNAMKDKITDRDEIAAIEHVGAQENQIIEAGKNLSAAPPEEDKKKKKP